MYLQLKMLKKLFSMNITNVILFFPFSERKKDEQINNARSIIGISITGNN